MALSGPHALLKPAGSRQNFSNRKQQAAFLNQHEQQAALLNQQAAIGLKRLILTLPTELRTLSELLCQSVGTHQFQFKRSHLPELR